MGLRDSWRDLSVVRASLAMRNLAHNLRLPHFDPLHPMTDNITKTGYIADPLPRKTNYSV